MFFPDAIIIFRLILCSQMFFQIVCKNRICFSDQLSDRRDFELTSGIPVPPLRKSSKVTSNCIVFDDNRVERRSAKKSKTKKSFKYLYDINIRQLSRDTTDDDFSSQILDSFEGQNSAKVIHSTRTVTQTEPKIFVFLPSPTLTTDRDENNEIDRKQTIEDKQLTTRSQSTTVRSRVNCPFVAQSRAMSGGISGSVGLPPPSGGFTSSLSNDRDTIINLIPPTDSIQSAGPAFNPNPPINVNPPTIATPPLSVNPPTIATPPPSVDPPNNANPPLISNPPSIQFEYRDRKFNQKTSEVQNNPQIIRVIESDPNRNPIIINNIIPKPDGSVESFVRQTVLPVNSVSQSQGSAQTITTTSGTQSTTNVDQPTVPVTRIIRLVPVSEGFTSSDRVVSGGITRSIAAPAVSGGFTASVGAPLPTLIRQPTPVVQTFQTANIFRDPLPSVQSDSPFMRSVPLMREKSIIISPPVPRKTTAVYTTQYTPATKTVVYETDNYPVRENLQVFSPCCESINTVWSPFPFGLSLTNTAHYIKSNILAKYMNSPFNPFSPHKRSIEI